MKKKLIFLVVGIVLSSVFVLTTCEMTVTDPVRYIPIVNPYISEQPQSYSYLTAFYELMTTIQQKPAGQGGGLFEKPFLPHPLTVKVDEWIEIDGDISYQWYTFESVEKYCEDPIGGTPIPDATEPVYNPVIPKNAEGKYDAKDYYYYCIVTNDYPDSTTEKSVTIQSELAVISLVAYTLPDDTSINNTIVGDALYAPVLTKQPRNASYPIGRTVSVAPLSVEAEPAQFIGNSANPQNLRVASGSVSYKWYTNDKFSAKDGTPIPGGTGATYTPVLAELEKGENYFYVEVTYTTKDVANPQFKTITCLPVVITMVPSTHAATPKITEQPRDQVVLGTQAIAALQVEAESPDDAILSYKWFSVDKPGATASLEKNGAGEYEPTEPTWTALDPAVTTATFTPTNAMLTALSNTTGYFGVEVTNTNDDASEVKTSTVRSKIITVTKSSVATGITANATITIPNDYLTVGSESRMQYIRGYGAMDVAWANFPKTTAADTELQYNPDWGLGFNMLRIMIVPPGSPPAGNFSSHYDLIANPSTTPSSPNVGGIIYGHRPDYLNNVKIVNKYGGYVLASPWTPPKEWKTNNSINSGGDLIPAYYPAYASYLREFAQFMYYQGAPIYAISIANEPNYAGGYDGCEWTGNQMRDFWKRVGRFTEGVRGYGGGRYIPTVLTMNGESANDPNINFSALDDPVSRAAMDVFARHVYGSRTNTLWRNAYADFKEGANEKECWMTEHNINSATPSAFVFDSTWNYVWRFMNDVDLVMRINNENAFVWWAGKRFYSFIGDNSNGTGDGNALPRGYGLSHYAKYTIGMRRIALKGDAIKGNLGSSGAAPNAVIVNGSDQVAVGDDPADTKKYATWIDANVNPCNEGLDTTGAKITAYVSQDGTEISLVMFTPTLTTGSGGVDMGTIEIKMPDGFKIGSSKAHRSKGAATNDVMQPEAVPINTDRTSAFVELHPGQILSVKLTKQL